MDFAIERDEDGNLKRLRPIIDEETSEKQIEKWEELDPIHEDNLDETMKRLSGSKSFEELMKEEGLYLSWEKLQDWMKENHVEVTVHV